MTLDGVCVSCQAGSGHPACKVRKCAQEKGVKICALCEEYPCEIFKEYFDNYPLLKHDNSIFREKGIAE
jgi:hypothetical protein